MLHEQAPAWPQPETARNLTPEDQRLLEAITLPPEAHAVLSAEFADGAQTIIESQITSAARSAVRAELAATNWRMFGDAELPGILLVRATSSTIRSAIELAPHPSSGIDALNSNSSFKGTPVNDTVNQYKKIQHDQLREYVAEVITELPTYQFFKSMTVDPPKQLQEQPLSTYWKQIKMSQAEQEIRNSHGIDQSAPIEPGSFAQQALSRAHSYIDLMTEQRPIDINQGQDTRTRLLTWFAKQYNLHKRPQDVPIAKINKCDEEEEEIIVTDMNGTQQHIFAEDVKVAINEWEQCTYGNIRSLQYLRDENLSQYFLFELLKHPELHPVDALSQAVERTADYEASIITYDVLKDETLIRLRGVQAPVYPTLLKRGKTHYNGFQWNSSTIVSRSEYEHAASYIVGSVAPAHHNVARPQLIMSVPPVELPAITESWDLQVSTNEFTHITQPLVLGFVPLAKQANADGSAIYYFGQSDRDLYTESDSIVIEQENREKLQQFLRSKNSLLAEAIAQIPVLTANDLQEAVREHTTYTFSSEIMSYSAWDNTQDGKIRLQCTGAAEILSDMMAVALPDAMVQTISGKSVNSQNKISYAGHAQVLVTHRGQQYILDGTPSSPEIAPQPKAQWGSNSLSSLGRITQKLMTSKQPANVSQEITQSASKSTMQQPEEPIATIQEFLTDAPVVPEVSTAPLRPTLEDVLQNAFQVPNQKELYKILAKLPRADPMQRAVSAAIRYEKSDGARDEREAAAQYLATCSAPKNVQFRKKFNIPAYDPALIELVHTLLTK